MKLLSLEFKPNEKLQTDSSRRKPAGFHPHRIQLGENQHVFAPTESTPLFRRLHIAQGGRVESETQSAIQAQVERERKIKDVCGM